MDTMHTTGLTARELDELIMLINDTRLAPHTNKAGRLDPGHPAVIKWQPIHDKLVEDRNAAIDAENNITWDE